MKRTVGNNEWLDIEVLDDYLEGKLDAGMMHKVERISLEDPFVAQALAGLTEAKKRTHTLSLLQKQLQERVAEKPVERKMWRMASHRLSIAATAAVLFLTVSVLFWMRENHRQQQAQLAANNKNIEIDLKPSAVAVAPVDTVIASTPKPETLLDQKKVEQALSNSIAKGSQAIAKNNVVKEQAIENAILQDKQFKSAKLKRDNYEKQTTVMAPMKAAPVSPVQALESRVEGIQVKTDPYARSVKGTVYDIQGRPLSGVDVKMVGDDLRSITNTSGEFILPINKDSNKVTLEVASLGFARKNIEAKANDKLDIRLEQSNNALSEVVVAGYGTQKKSKASIGATKTTDTLSGTLARHAVAKALPMIGVSAYQNYLKKNNKFYKNGSLAVELSIVIGENGTPSDIQILKGQTVAMNEEAIRLVKEGPKWSYFPKTLNTTVVVVKF